MRFPVNVLFSGAKAYNSAVGLIKVFNFKSLLEAPPTASLSLNSVNVLANNSKSFPIILEGVERGGCCKLSMINYLLPLQEELCQKNFCLFSFLFKKCTGRYTVPTVQAIAKAELLANCYFSKGRRLLRIEIVHSSVVGSKQMIKLKISI
jgi:hypothetical protein